MERGNKELKVTARVMLDGVFFSFSIFSALFLFFFFALLALNLAQLEKIPG